MLHVLAACVLTLADGGFTQLSPMINPRFRGETWLLPDGKVLACGGAGDFTCDIYDPDAERWSVGPVMNGPHALTGGAYTVNAQPLLVDNTGATSEETLVDGGWVARNGGPAVDLSPVVLLRSGELMVATGNRVMGSTRAVWYRSTDGTWRSNINFSTAFNSHTLSELPSGAVLLVRGWAGNYRASGDGGSFVSVVPTPGFMSDHTATVLYDGSLLSCGPDCDRTTDEGATWQPVAWPLDGINFTSATLLPNASLWFIGGRDGGAISSGHTALFHPDGGWSNGPSLNNPRSEHHAVLLPTGRVLVVGGVNASTVAELADMLVPSVVNGPALTFDPGEAAVAWLPSGNSWLVGLPNARETWLFKNGVWVAGASLPEPRNKPSAVVLRTGHVLISGGGPVQSLLYDESNDSLMAAGAMPVVQVGAEARLLATGQVLSTGGRGVDGGQVLAATALFDPAVLTWAAGVSLPAPREGHSMTVLRDGSVLVVGGSDGANLSATAWTWNPGASSWRTETAMTTARAHHSATLLPDGQVLIAGGLNAAGNGLATAQTYNPATRTWSAEVALNHARGRHAAVLMPSNYVLFAGGVDQSTPRASTELYDVVTRRSTLSAPMQTARAGPRFIRLSDWRVLVISGGSTTSDVFDEGRGTGPWAPAVSGSFGVVGPGAQVSVTGQRFRGWSSASSGNYRASPSDFPVFTAVRDDGAVWRLTTTFFTPTQASFQAPADIGFGRYHLFAAVNGTLSGRQGLTVGLGTGQTCSSGQQCLSLNCSGVCQAPSTGSVIDAGAPDAGDVDAGTPDAGEVDAGGPDAGTSDAGPMDAGTSDAGEPDADAGPSDFGPPDSGTPDSGPVNAGQTEPGLYIVGCGCNAFSKFMAWPFAVWVLWRGRRRRH